MDPIKGLDNIKHSGKVTTVVHVFWSQQRSWHGGKVKMFVKTEFIKGGTGVEIKVLAKDDNTEIDKVSGKKISASNLDCDYDIQWKDKPFAEERLFVLKALVRNTTGKQLEQLSAPLYVDLDPPVFSA